MVPRVTALKALIFDFDGVIVESTGIKDEAFKKLFQDYPRQLKRIMAYHESHNAVVRFDKFRYITEYILGKTYTKSIEKKLSREFSAIVLPRVLRCPFVKGAKGFLNDFSRKVPLYVVSVNPPHELKKILKKRKIERYFKKVYAIPQQKSKALKEILQRERIRAREAAFIGDSFEDFQAAKKIKMPFIARNSGKSFKRVRVPLFNDFHGIRNFLNTQRVLQTIA